jgi:hypothetical protein
LRTLPFRWMALILLTCAQLAWAPARAQTTGPAFSTTTATAGVSNGTLYVFLPFTNSGDDLATDVIVTSATLAGHVPGGSVLPSEEGDLSPSQSSELEFHFDAASFVAGQRYLLTLRGTYQYGAANLAFTLNRFVTVQQFDADDLAVLQQFEAINAVSAVSDALPGVDLDQDDQAILAFMQTRPEFVDSGINDTTVWGEFSDGQVFAVVNGDLPFPADGSLPFLSSSAASTGAAQLTSASGRTTKLTSAIKPSGLSPQLAPGDFPPIPFPNTDSALPKSSIVRTLSGFDMVKPLGTLVGQLVKPFGYAPTNGPATLAVLRTIGQTEGVVVLTTHGGFIKKAPGYWVTSSDPLDPQRSKTDPDMKPDPQTHAQPKIAYMHVVVGVGKKGKIWRNRYAIGQAFINEYWQGFDPSSLVFINACQSLVDADFQQAVLNSGVGLLAGWTGKVNGLVSVGAGLLMFDRFLGADSFCPEDGAPTCTIGAAQPPVYAQRAFDYQSVAWDLMHHSITIPSPGEDCDGLTTCPLSVPGRLLQFVENLDHTFWQLAPEIDSVITEEQKSGPSTLQLIGWFGPAAGRISVSGQTLSCDWDFVSPSCSIPNSGPGASGQVRAVVNGHPSAVHALTQWQGDFNLTISGPDSVMASEVLHADFRNDIQSTRTFIHLPPGEPNEFTGSEIVLSSMGAAQCSGSTGSNQTSAQIVFSGGGTGAVDGLSTVHSSSSMSISLLLTDSVCIETFVESGVPPASDPYTPPGTPSLDNSGGVPLVMNGQGTIAAGSAATAAFGTHTTVNWNAISPVSGSAPDPTTPR